MAGNEASGKSAFVCSLCHAPHPSTGSEYTCLTCGPRGILEPATRMPAETSSAPFTGSPGIWRYERLLTLSLDAPRPPLTVGGTPLVRSQRLGHTLSLRNLYIKNDTLNPTGSLKDRASAVALARAAQIGVSRVAVASTGNAGSSLAGLAASMGIPAVIFVPTSAPRAKLLQALTYGAEVFTVRGSYDDAFQLCSDACAAFGWYNRNTAFNPYTLEGKKTVAYEIYEQLGNRAPDMVVVPTGDGAILSGVARGFRDLQSLGLISRLPQLIAVQAQGSDAISRALRSGQPITAIAAHSVADSITVNLPRNGAMAVRDLLACGGSAVTVPDDAILRAVYDLARLTGIFAEPAAAASLAGLQAMVARGEVDPDTSVVLLVTGSGLKDIDSAARAAPAAQEVGPALADLVAILPRTAL